METLRCPTCLNRLSDGGVKHCPACGARVRSRRRANLLPDDAAFNRPRVLVERELQARIEAQTAPHFLQRRRAAKTARRIASLPHSLFESGVVVEPGTGTWSPPPWPTVIDIPVNAIHETPRAGALPVAAAADDAPAARPRWRRWKPARTGDNGDAYEPTDIDLVEVVEVPAPPPFTPEPEPADEEPRARRAGRSGVIGARWSAWRATREANRKGEPAPAEAESEAATEVEAAPAAVAHQPYDWDADEPVEPRRRPRRRLIPDRWRTWQTRPPDTDTATPAASTSGPPEPPRRRARIEPREVAPAARAPRGAEHWQPSESLWARRVFNSRAQGPEVAGWPRPRPPKQDVTTGE